ncbi:MAG TPA: GvpL/GvpF family gas vesicle protein [Amycolatopsis sp.]|uniref:GvpL/GvpF family gas vesicle protein n=1 Tax=Amycolatopsis sp. TaxID=37632 RepID=UPI002B45F9E3|nr:GvpL/GvpF family gas vesicle protein [Amycolatopsis sp.]HKS49754.1 GvpL/GvpF family gas vesicle protein [Amycolatopsis sp.]
MTEHYGSWLYAVTRQAGATFSERLTGVAGEPLHAIEESGLVAVAGSVPLSSFGDEALRRNFEDLDWLGAVARAHDAVVDAVSRAGPAVPLRLATVYLDDERVRLVLQHRKDDFARVLDRVAGRTEWGVKVVFDPARLREPEVAAAGGGTRPGAAYLQRRRTELAARDREERFAVEQAEKIHSALSALAVEARRHRPQSPRLSGNAKPMILNAAYLVDDEATREFTRAVAEQDGGHAAIQLQLTGPWPPYSFSSLEEPAP